VDLLPFITKTMQLLNRIESSPKRSPVEYLKFLVVTEQLMKSDPSEVESLPLTPDIERVWIDHIVQSDNYYTTCKLFFGHSPEYFDVLKFITNSKQHENENDVKAHQIISERYASHIVLENNTWHNKLGWIHSLSDQLSICRANWRSRTSKVTFTELNNFEWFGKILETNREVYDRAMLGYQCFLYLIAKYPDSVSDHNPPSLVRLILFAHQLHCESYVKDCKALLGKVLVTCGDSTSNSLWDNEFSNHPWHSFELKNLFKRE
jgi:hypothetical protein